MILTHSKMSCLAVLGVLGVLAGNGLATVVPFTEDFSNDAANWFHADGLNPVNWVATGGPDGGAYVSTIYIVPDPVPPFRALPREVLDPPPEPPGRSLGALVLAGGLLLSALLVGAL